MSPTHLPPDFDRLPEFRMLCHELEKAVAAQFPESKDLNRVSAQTIDDMAIVIWVRLWCALAYQTSAGDLPGHISAEELALWAQAYLRHVPLESADVVRVLVAARVLGEAEEEVEDGVLRPPSAVLRPPSSFFCGVFARNNKHLDPRAERHEIRANRHSGISKNLSHSGRQAQEQMLLLAAEVCHRRDGSEMTPEEKVLSMTAVKCIDNVLNRRHREMYDYGAGLMADALEFTQRFATDASRREFYFWLSDRLPEVPKTTEQILANLVSLVALRQKAEMLKS